MDAKTKALISERVTHEISKKLVTKLGGKMPELKTPDAVKEQDWVALSTMLIQARRDLSTLIEMVLSNEDGGLTYMAALTVIHDKIVDTAKCIEDALVVKTNWFPEQRIDRAKTGDKAGDYFYAKLRREVEAYLDKKGEKKDEL